ncbi:MAG: hypothetical protein RR052_06300 [Oscillospiraceae bacterium]
MPQKKCLKLYLKKQCAEILGIQNYDPTVFLKQIDHIELPANPERAATGRRIWTQSSEQSYLYC